MAKARTNPAGTGQLEKDMRELIEKLRRIPKELDREERKKILRYAAIPLVDAAQRLAPVSDSVHYRYSTPKLSNKMRAPKGKGVKIAKYEPGNLRGAIGELKHGPFRKSPNLFVGVKRGRRGSRGTFGRNKFDGYYAHFVEFGTVHQRARPFMRPAFEMTKAQVLKRIRLGLQVKLRKYARRMAA